jgi:endonuclease/exonuclease/phosphatase family metal-dependent hydrolase
MRTTNTISILVCALLVLSEARSSEIRVMSFNILQDTGSPSGSANAWIYNGGPNRRERAVQVMVDAAPDILGFQEAEENQVAELTSTNALSAYGFYGFGRDDAAGNGLHEGIFYLTNRFARTDEGVFWLSQTPDTPGSQYPGAAQVRIAVWAALTDRQTGRAYFVMSTHFDYQSSAAREYSAGLIRERIGTMASNMPVIVTGDFNLYPYEDSYGILTNQVTPGWVVLHDSLRAMVPTEGPDELTRHSFTGNTAGDRVDYIFFSPEFTATQAGIDRTSYDGGRYPSDHYPVTATLSIEPARPVITRFEQTGEGFDIEWDSVPEMTYGIVESDDLLTWTNAFPGTPPLTATGTTATVVLSPTPEPISRFYRVSYPAP